MAPRHRSCTTAPANPTCSSCPSSPAASSAPAPTSSTTRSAARSPSSWTETDFDGKRGDVLAVPTGGRLGARAALLVGVGDARRRSTRPRCGAPARCWPGARRRSRRVATTLLDAVGPTSIAGAAAQAFAEGVVLGSYQFLRYKSDAKPSQARHASSVVARSSAKVRAGLERGARIAEAVAWARDLVNEPAAAKSPADVVAHARKLARGVGAQGQGVRRRATRARAHGRRASVSAKVRTARRGSCASSTRRQGARATVAFVGKGVVFDSGGLSLKTAGGMETMKTDMSGAAAVIAAMSALRDLGVKHAGDRLRAARREHAERQRDAAGRRADDAQRQDGRGA